MESRLNQRLENVATTDEVLFYTSHSGEIFAVKVFGDYVMIRPATPGRYNEIRKMPFSAFNDEFEPLLCAPEEVERVIRYGEFPVFKQERRH